METERGQDAAGRGPGKPGVLSYASPAVGRPSDNASANGFNFAVVIGILFLVAACTMDLEKALIVLVVEAVLYIAYRLTADGHRPEWMVAVVAILAGVTIVAIGMQVAIVVSDPGHPQSRWRLALFKPSPIVVVASVGTVAGLRRTRRS